MLYRFGAAVFLLVSILVLCLQPAVAVPGMGTLFGTDASSGNLLAIDPTSGAASIIGSIGLPVPSLATDPTSGVLYAVSGAGAPNLYTLNPASGVPTLVGDTMLGFASVGGLDFDSAGVLFGSVNIAGDGGTGSDHLATIDKMTGLATVIGPFGTCTGITIPSIGGGSCSIEGMEGIAFNAAGVLYGVKSQRGAAGTPGLYTISLATGAATLVAPILDANGNPPSGGLVSVQFAANGTLYGGTARATGMATDGGFLVTLDPGSGLFAFVGAVSATGGLSLGGLAFAEPAAPPPPPMVFEIPTLSQESLALLAVLITVVAVAGLTRFN